MIGPMSDPGGTLHRMLVRCNADVGQQTNWVQPLRYDMNQPNTQPSRLYDVFRCCSNVVRSEVSNAADRSRRVNKARSPASRAHNMSLRTYRTAVSVE